MKNIICISSNTAWSIYNFRIGLIKKLKSLGYDIVIIAPQDRFSGLLSDSGCQVYDIRIDNKGTNPFADLFTIFQYKKLYTIIKPCVIINYTIKPVIYGSIIARICKIPCINVITGLGTAFVRENLITNLIEVLYKISQKRIKKCFFLNKDDANLFLKRKLISSEKIDILPGEGVDLKDFSEEPLKEKNQVSFLLVARLLWDKGVGDFINAAKIIKMKYPQVKFQLLGPLGVANRSAISKEQVDEWVLQKLVEYLGETDNVKPFLIEADCIVLPSFYREGVPRSLLEASAVGRPIITTDMVGCKDVVDDGINGFLCKPKDPIDLAEKIEKFLLLTHKQRLEMGKNGRLKMEREYDEKIVISKYLEVINGL